MHILVTGGCGYIGSILTEKLLKKGFKVTVYDIMWFGNYLQPHPHLKIITGDIRETKEIPLKGIDCIIHLAAIANDPSVELNPKLSWEVNVLATMLLADAAVRNGIKQFIFASSASVYGVKEEENVTEELELEPISEYNKTKMVGERVLLSYSDKMSVQIIRPATVCGYSPRIRLDLSVNMLTALALFNNEITVFGGKQQRPNIYIQDLTDLYIFMIEHPDIQGVFNAGFENTTILGIAEKITKYKQAKITITESNDPRSYRINSDKIIEKGFVPKYNIEDGIKDIIEMYNKNTLRMEDQHFNVKWMKKTKVQ